MNIVKFKLAIFGLVILSSCQNNPHEDKITTIEQLQTKLDGAAKVYEKLDTTGYKGFESKYKLNVAFVQQKLEAKGDTIQRETALLMADYRELKKPTAQFKTKYLQAGKELEFSEKQLITLKHDLTNNNMDTLIAGHMLVNEIKSTESIISTIEQLSLVDKKTRKTMDLLNPKIDSLITVLKQY